MTTTATTEKVTLFGHDILVDYSRDKLLTAFGKATLTDRYLWKGENFQTMFARVAAANASDTAHAQRMYDYISQLWFMPATPVLSNSGHEKNLEISCYLNEVGDSLEEIAETFNENIWLASRGGGIGTSWNPVREIGAPVGIKGETSGIIPFVKIQDSQTLGISQGNLRRGSAAVYLDVSHPEIEEFLDIRRPTGGDPNRKCLNIHQGVVIPDAFMEAVKDNSDWNLISRLTGDVVSKVKARELWQKILAARLETGEPYLWFVDNVNRLRPEVYKRNGLFNSQSNLCSEIALATGIDYNDRRRTAVCCLSSLNLETWDQWEGNEDFIYDVMLFLDNVMSNFLRKTEGLPGFDRARYAAMQERSIGLGVMGFHSYLQSKAIPFESALSKSFNFRVFKWLKDVGDRMNVRLGGELGPCPDALRVGLRVRFSHIFAVAPTASISIIAGNASPGIEPIPANSVRQKTLSGSFAVRNKWLHAALRMKFVEIHGYDSHDSDYDAKEREWVESQWELIDAAKGSVQGLDYLEQDLKDVFKTAFELDQRWLIDLAADRTPFICQGQSLNLFIYANVSKKLLNEYHYRAWQKGLKGLYYCRSRSIQQATNVAGEMPQAMAPTPVHLEPNQPKVEEVIEPVYTDNQYDECLACQ